MVAGVIVVVVLLVLVVVLVIVVLSATERLQKLVGIFRQFRYRIITFQIIPVPVSQ